MPLHGNAGLTVGAGLGDVGGEGEHCHGEGYGSEHELHGCRDGRRINNLVLLVDNV